jgi:2',3'-cyclic-nucleotide 2'-phosphodiesterase
MQIYFFGDIVGVPALERVCQYVQELKTNNPDAFFFANVENVAGGFGILEDQHNKLIKAGFSLLSGGNHIWDKKEIFSFISRSKIARPCNLPKNTPGKGWQIIETPRQKIGLINVLGRVFMNVNALECPFRACDNAIEQLKAERVKHIIVDIHAEASSEKLALAHYLDGQVSAIVGSHTHVQTADEGILPKGTLFISDLGACCSINSILGMSKESVLHRFLTGLPGRLELQTGPTRISGVKLTLANISATDSSTSFSTTGQREEQASNTIERINCVY